MTLKRCKRMIILLAEFRSNSVKEKKAQECKIVRALILIAALFLVAEVISLSEITPEK